MMKSVLLGSTALICLGLTASPAFSACTNTAPTTGTTVDCTGASTTAVTAGATQTNITVNAQDGSTLTVSTGTAVHLYDGSTINLLGNANVTTSAGGAANLLIFGTHGTVTLNGTSQVNTTSAGPATGVNIYGGSGRLVMNGGSHITTHGVSSNGAFVGGGNDVISLNDDSIIHTYGINSYGLQVHGNSETINLSGNSEIITNGLAADAIFGIGDDSRVTIDNGVGTIRTAGSNAPGISLLGNRNTVSLSGRDVLITSGSNSDGVYVNGTDAAVTINTQNNYAMTYGTNSHAVEVRGLRAAVTLNGVSIVGTHADNSDGVRITGDYGAVTLNQLSALGTQGNTADAINMIGNHGAVTLNDQAFIATNGANSSGISVTGDHADITLNGSSHILTAGSGGLGIGAFGDSNAITLKGHSAIDTTGGGFGILVNGQNNTILLEDQSSVQTSNSMTSILLTGNGNTVQIDQGASVSSTNGFAIVGDLNPANSDTVTNAGRIIGGGGMAIDLRAGDDTLNLTTGSQITGSIDGGAGTDTLNLSGSGSEDDIFLNFETLIVANAGSWSLSGNSTFSTAISVNSGRLAVNGTLTSPVTTVGAGGILGGNGTLNSDVTSTGTIAPGNSVGTLTINGNFTQTGGAFDVQVDKNGVDRLNVMGAGGATLASSPTLNILPQGGATGGAGIILHAPNGITGSFGTITYQGNGAADVTQTATDISLITVDGTPVVGSAFAASESGLDYLDSVNDEQLAGLRRCGADTCDRTADQRFHLWAKGFGRFGNEAAEAGNQSFDYRIAGSALGGDMSVADGLRLGVSFGYSNTDETLAHNAADADIDTTQAALYANYQQGPYFITGLVSGGWQHFDQSRQMGGGSGSGGLTPGSNANNEADSSTHGWLFGSSLQAGAQFRFPKGWMLTPSAGVSYQHQWINGTSEHGGGAADVAIASHQADALRLKAQLVLSQDYQLTGYTITPHLKLGVQQQYNLGGRADGTFSDGTDFTLDLMKTDRTIGLAGVGIDVAFDNGFSTYVDYDGALAAGRTVHSLTGGLRYSW